MIPEMEVLPMTKEERSALAAGLRAKDSITLPHVSSLQRHGMTPGSSVTERQVSIAREQHEQEKPDKVQQDLQRAGSASDSDSGDFPGARELGDGMAHVGGASRPAGDLGGLTIPGGWAQMDRPRPPKAKPSWFSSCFGRSRTGVGSGRLKSSLARRTPPPPTCRRQSGDGEQRSSADGCADGDENDCSSRARLDSPDGADDILIWSTAEGQDAAQASGSGAPVDGAQRRYGVVRLMMVFFGHKPTIVTNGRRMSVREHLQTSKPKRSILRPPSEPALKARRASALSSVYNTPKSLRFAPGTLSPGGPRPKCSGDGLDEAGGEGSALHGGGDTDMDGGGVDEDEDDGIIKAEMEDAPFGIGLRANGHGMPVAARSRLNSGSLSGVEGQKGEQAGDNSGGDLLDVESAGEESPTAVDEKAIAKKHRYAPFSESGALATPVVSTDAVGQLPLPPSAPAVPAPHRPGWAVDPHGRSPPLPPAAGSAVGSGSSAGGSTSSRPVRHGSSVSNAPGASPLRQLPSPLMVSSALGSPASNSEEQQQQLPPAPSPVGSGRGLLRELSSKVLMLGGGSRLSLVSKAQVVPETMPMRPPSQQPAAASPPPPPAASSAGTRHSEAWSQPSISMFSGNLRSSDSALLPGGFRRGQPTSSPHPFVPVDASPTTAHAAPPAPAPREGTPVLHLNRFNSDTSRHSASFSGSVAGGQHVLPSGGSRALLPNMTFPQKGPDHPPSPLHEGMHGKDAHRHAHSAASRPAFTHAHDVPQSPPQLPLALLAGPGRRTTSVTDLSAAVSNSLALQNQLHHVPGSFADSGTMAGASGRRYTAEREARANEIRQAPLAAALNMLSATQQGGYGPGGGGGSRRSSHQGEPAGRGATPPTSGARSRSRRPSLLGLYSSSAVAPEPLHAQQQQPHQQQAAAELASELDFGGTPDSAAGSGRAPRSRRYTVELGGSYNDRHRGYSTDAYWHAHQPDAAPDSDQEGRQDIVLLGGDGLPPHAARTHRPLQRSLPGDVVGGNMDSETLLQLAPPGHKEHEGADGLPPFTLRATEPMASTAANAAAAATAAGRPGPLPGPPPALLGQRGQSVIDLSVSALSAMHYRKQPLERKGVVDPGARAHEIRQAPLAAALGLLNEERGMSFSSFTVGARTGSITKMQATYARLQQGGGAGGTVAAGRRQGAQLEAAQGGPAAGEGGSRLSGFGAAPRLAGTHGPGGSAEGPVAGAGAGIAANS